MRTHFYCLATAACCVALSNASAQDSLSTATGISRSFNPAISANGLFIAAYQSEDGRQAPESATGMRVQEVEVQLSAFVDAYLKADLILAVPGGEGLELEEGFLTSQGWPVTLKTGRFLADFGRHNRLHSHQFPFLDAPQVNQRLFGDEGLVETGIAASLLLPVPWYSEASAQVLNGDGELFGSVHGEDLLYLGHVRNFWDLSEVATVELGGSAATGANAAAEITSILGADLTLKWSAPRTRSRSFVWQSEYMYARHNVDGERRREGGLYTLAQLQVARRWWIQARYDLFGLPEADDTVNRISSLVAFVPSEFSAVRLQYSHLDEVGESENQVMAQLNFTIGSHPAHRY